MKICGIMKNIKLTIKINNVVILGISETRWNCSNDF